ncbi:hypothetical protein YC2023_113138 [Brassica napus]
MILSCPQADQIPSMKFKRPESVTKLLFSSLPSSWSLSFSFFQLIKNLSFFFFFFFFFLKLL